MPFQYERMQLGPINSFFITKNKKFQRRAWKFIVSHLKESLFSKGDMHGFLKKWDQLRVSHPGFEDNNENVIDKCVFEVEYKFINYFSLNIKLDCSFQNFSKNDLRFVNIALVKLIVKTLFVCSLKENILFELINKSYY